MVQQFSLFGQSSSNSPESEGSERASYESDAGDFDEVKHVSLDHVVECLIRSGLRHPLYADQVIESLVKIAHSTGSAKVADSVIHSISESTHMYKRSHRLLVYEALSRVIASVPFKPRELSSSASAVKSFVIRMIGDIEKSSKIESESTIRHFAKLIAVLCLSSFRDLAVGVLLTPEFVLGRPTVASVVVVDSLIELFGNLLDKDTFSTSLMTIMGKIETVPSLRSNDLLISAVLKGFHRTGLSVQSAREIEPSLRSLYESTSDGSMSPESIEAALYLMSLMSSGISTLPRVAELADAIEVLGNKGLENDDCRVHFAELLSIVWTHRIPLFSEESETTEILGLLLLSDHPQVWALGRDEAILPFLIEKFGSSNEELKGLALRAIEAVAAARETLLDKSIVELIDQQMIAEDVELSVESVVGVLRILKSVHGSLITPFMIAYVERFLCSPASAVAVRFPDGILDKDLDLIHQGAKQTLLAFAAKSLEQQFGEQLLARLLESLEHMPSVGISSICEAITIILASSNKKLLSQPSLPPSQSFIILVWLLISIDLHVENAEAIIACLVTMASVIHPSLDALWEMGPESRLVQLFNRSRTFESEIAHVFQALEFRSRDDRDRYFNQALETILVLLPTSVPLVKARLIDTWEHIMNIMVPDQSISTFTSRVMELLGLEDAVGAAPDCVIATARAVGRLADRRFDAIIEVVWKQWSTSNTALISLSSIENASSISNAIRIKNNKSSLRGLFSFEKTERAIVYQLNVKEVALRALGHAVAACPANRLSDLRTKECVEAMLVRQLRLDVASLQAWLDMKPGKEDAMSVTSLTAVIESIEKTATAISSADGGAVDNEFYSKLQHECLAQLLLLLNTVSKDLPLFPMEPILLAIAALVDVRHLSISSDLFGDILETTLECLVHSVPDNPGSLNAVSEEAIRLTSRCQASAQVVKSLLGHASSWLGFSRLVKAVFALGGNGPLPLVRWVCVRIVREIADDTDIVKTDSDINEFLEVVATLIPRISDSYLPVQTVAQELLKELLLRCQFTKDIVVDVHSLTISLSAAIPDVFVSGYVLSLVSQVHDSDAANAAVDAINHALSQRASVFSAADSAAEAVVDAILSNAALSYANIDSPIPSSLTHDGRVRLVTSLKFLAAVRFPVTIKEVLKTNLPELSQDKVHAIHSFVRDKSTLLALAKELMDRMNRPSEDVQENVIAAIAMGHVLDCFDDTGVVSVATKFFPEIYLALLVLWWRCRTENASAAAIKLVIHKLCRATSGNGIGRLPDSVTTENGIRLILERNESFTGAMMDFLKPFLVLESHSGQRQAAIVLACQLVGTHSSVDEQLWPIFFSICEKNDGQIEVHHAIKGLSRILRLMCSNKLSTDAIKQVENILSLFSTNISSFDNEIALEALIGVRLVAGATSSDSNGVTLIRVLMSHSLGQIRRVVDHTDARIRSEAFKTISEICNIVACSSMLDGDDEKCVTQFFTAVSDLWIPCLVRSQDEPGVKEHALTAFQSIINSAVADRQVSLTQAAKLDSLFDIVREEIAECSVNHLNSCSYYLLGLPSVSESVAIAAGRLAPVLVSLIPSASAEAGVVVADMIEKLLSLSQSVKGINLVIANLVIQGKRMDQTVIVSS